MTLLSADTFNRADNTSVVGSTNGAGSLDPLTWTTQTGTCGIAGNQAYASALTSGLGIATLDLGVADVDLSLTLSNVGNGGGLVFRFVDTSNYWVVRYAVSTVGVALVKIVAGSPTGFGTEHSASSGDVIRVVAAGSTITVYKNGTQIETTTDSFSSTATKHGYRTASTTARFDSWSASSAIASQNVTVPLISPTTIYAPTIIPPQTITVPLVSPTMIYGPTIIGPQTVTVPLVTASPTIYGPTVSLLGYITVPFVNAAPTIRAPSVGLEPPAPGVVVDTDPIAIRVVTTAGTLVQTLPLARVETITRTKNQPDEAIIVFPKYAYTRDQVHIFADDSGSGGLHEIQIVRNGRVRFWGPAVSAEGGSGQDGGEVTLHCRGVDWYLTRRFIDGQRTNELANPSFETGTTASWTAAGPTAAVTADNAVRGDYSLRLTSATDLADFYEYQTVQITGTGVGTLLTVAGYFNIESITGHALDRRGLYIEGRKDGVLQTNNFFALDEANPTGEWTRARTTIQIPPFETWDVQVRLYSPPGSILWDDLQVVAMQSVSTATLTGNTWEPVDVSRIVRLIVAHCQSAAVGKSDVAIGLITPTVGVRQVKHIQWADHISWPDQMAEWLDRDDCFDYSIHYTLTTRQLILHAPQQGTDRRPTVTLTFPGNVAQHNYTEDGAGSITDDTELDDDSGDGPDREEGHYADASLIGGLTLQAVNSAPPKTEPSGLDPIAREAVKKARRPAQLYTFTLLGAQELGGVPYDELLGLGDVFLFDVTDGWISGSGYGRVAQLVEHPKDRRLEVTFTVAVP